MLPVVEVVVDVGAEVAEVASFLTQLERGVELGAESPPVLQRSLHPTQGAQWVAEEEAVLEAGYCQVFQCHQDQTRFPEHLSLEEEVEVEGVVPKVIGRRALPSVAGADDVALTVVEVEQLQVAGPYP